MASVTLHADGRVDVTEPPTPEEIAQAEEELRRVAAALMGMAIEQLEREDRDRAADRCAEARGGTGPGGV
jgi:hypothetical protein